MYAPLPDRPVVALAMAPTAMPDVLPPAVVSRIQRVAEFDAATSLADFGTPPARRILARTDILLTGWGCPRVDAATLHAAPRLRAVVHAAGSVRRPVAPEVYERGVLVSSAAEANARPVAEYTLATLVLAAKRALERARAYQRDGLFLGASYPRSLGLAGTTVGVVGASRIGRLVVAGLRRLDVHVLLYDPYLTAADAAALGAEAVDLDTLCGRADVVTVHAPQLPETRHMIDDRRLALMRDGAVLINTSRGSLVDTEALTRHCGQGRIDAVLDVTDPEPLPAGHPLLRLDNVLITPHLAGAEGLERRRLGEYAADEIERLVAGRPLAGLVRADDLTRIA
ncbi:hydroxyacid dehydrogenase [Streptomyces sp. NPDC007861]|uniref:hydroxyacid dehydrogenase n=1 Tax=Streptomyces sp. NPDC007861 TaxID=3154893 RepID=UPI0033E06A15